VSGKRRPAPGNPISSDGLPLAFAGLWEECRDPDGQAIGCCAIIVTRANALVQPIHDRMPMILEPRAYGPWLSVDNAEDLTQLLVPFPPANMEAYPVDRWVNNPQNQGAACRCILRKDVYHSP
jgi:putative SOS response-associated peptidase YedK